MNLYKKLKSLFACQPDSSVILMEMEEDKRVLICGPVLDVEDCVEPFLTGLGGKWEIIELRRSFNLRTLLYILEKP